MLEQDVGSFEEVGLKARPRISRCGHGFPDIDRFCIFPPQVHASFGFMIL